MWATKYGRVAQGLIRGLPPDSSSGVTADAWSMSNTGPMLPGNVVPSRRASTALGATWHPFVEMEWGRRAYELMWQLKELFDPGFVLNPGVVLSHVRKAQALVCMLWIVGV